MSRLSELAGIALNSDQADLLAEMNSFNIEGRYPEGLVALPTKEEALSYIVRAGMVYEWLITQF